LDIIGSAHLFRHVCASHMLENGADIRFIQMQLRHQGLSTTELYIRVSIEQLKQVHNATNPAKVKTKAENQAVLLDWLENE